MQSKTYMGRIFLAPVSASPPGKSTIYINIGWNTCGGQLYPEYSAEQILQEICEEQQYNELKESLQSYLSSRGIPASCAVCSVLCLPCSLPCCFLMMCAACCVTRGLKGIVADHGSGRIGTSGGWRYPIRMVMPTAGMPTAHVEQSMGFDQYGNILMNDGGKRSPHPIWPPLGYNIVVDIPDDQELHKRWPRKSGDKLLPKGRPGHWSGPASAPPMQEPMNRFGYEEARVHPDAAHSSGGGGIAEQLQKLNALKVQGVLSDAEFEVAKAKVLSS